MIKTVKNTLKIVLPVLMFLPIIFIMTACGGNTSIDGTWYVQSATNGSTTLDRSQITNELTDKNTKLDDQFKLVIKESNTFELLTPASTTAQTGTWVQDTTAKEDTYKLTTTDNHVYTVTYESSNTIKVAIDDTTYYVFKKK